MRIARIISFGLTAVFLLLPADLSEAETNRREPVESIDPPQLPRVITLHLGDPDGDWLLAAAIPGPGDFLRPTPVGPSFPGPQPSGLYLLDLTSQDAFFSVCPAWHVPDCGTSAPNAVRPLTGIGMLQLRAYVTSAGWALRCPRFAKGDATVADEDGSRYRVTLHEVIVEDMLTRECRSLHKEIHVEPVR